MTVHPLPQEVVAADVGGQLRPHHKGAALQVHQFFGQRVRGHQAAGHADDAHRLIQGAIGFGARIGLGDVLTGKKLGAALVAVTGGNAHGGLP